MGGGAAGGQWRHQQWSPSWPPSWILTRTKNQVKTARNGNFLLFTWKITHKLIINKLLLLLKKVDKTFTFTQTWLDHLLFMTSYLVTIKNNHSNWPSLNLSQNVREGWTNSYWKRQVLMFYPLGKPSRPHAHNAQTLLKTCGFFEE